MLNSDNRGQSGEVFNKNKIMRGVQLTNYYLITKQYISVWFVLLRDCTILAI